LYFFIGSYTLTTLALDPAKNSVEDALFIAGSNANVVNVYDPMKKYKEIDISDE
jgi:hypothetical protein